MLNLNPLYIAGAVLALFTLPAGAQIPDGWSGEASLSGSRTSGNTETTDIGIALKVKNTEGIYRNKFKATYDLGTVDERDNKNRLFLGYQLDRDFNDQVYGFGSLNYFSDDFGAYETGYYAGGGLGYKVYLEEPLTLSFEGGLGYRNQQTRPTGTQGTDGFIASLEESELAALFGSDFSYDFNEAVSFKNNTEILISDSDTYTWNDAGITAKMGDNLSAKFGIRIDHHTDVPVGRENTDTITRGTLVYKMQ